MTGTLAFVRQRRNRGRRAREQWAKDDFGAGSDCFRGRSTRAGLGAAIVLHDELEAGLVEIEDRKLGGLLHRLGDGGGLWVAGGRQQQGDFYGFARGAGPACRQRSGSAARSWSSP